MVRRSDGDDVDSFFVLYSRLYLHISDYKRPGGLAIRCCIFGNGPRFECVSLTAGSSGYSDFEVVFSWVCEKIGRRVTIIVSAFVAVIANFCVVFSVNYGVRTNL